MDVPDRIPELHDLLVEVIADLMELDDDEGVTVADVAARIPELDVLFDKVDFFLGELDSVSVAVEFWCGELDETDEYEAAGWIETERGAVFAGFPWDAADDADDQDEED
jgi:hypothetical protein